MQSHSTLTTYTYKAIRSILGPIIRTIWVKSHTNIHHIKTHKKAAIVAANHQSFFDFLCLVSVSGRNIHFLSAEKFFKRGLWKPLMVGTGQIKVERNATDKSVVHSRVKTHILKNDLVGIFPEGTRAPSETEMLKAYTGVARYALEHNVPVIPVGIKGTHAIHNRESKKMLFKKNVEIVVGEPMIFSYPEGSSTNPEILEAVTRTIMDEIAHLSGKVYPH
ncbi:MAG: lysophospholipid acyltransferase family protein [Patescibacteria group bacterium]